MKVERKDLDKFKRLKISNILDLSIIAPSKYLDYRLKKSLQVDREQLFYIMVKHIEQKQKFVKITAYCKNLEKDIELIFFRFLDFHKKVFFIGRELFVFGKVDINFSKISIIQPKIVNEKNVGSIYPVYKTSIRVDIFRKLIEKYINIDNLSKYPIPQKYIKNILLLHYPNDEVLDFFYKNRTFPKELLDALKFIEIFNYMRKLSKKRLKVSALISCEKDIEPFLKNLPFKLTDDQIKAIKDIKDDLSKDIAAKRVIVGDVGSGKSMVMFATAFLAYPNRAILMAPTTILANQLYEEAKKYLKGMDIALVTSSSAIENLEKYHFIIGTHALLYRKLPKACVIMVDEQHRFGTKQRNLLKELISNRASSPHFFQFSATPIPRTMSMVESNLVDFSFLKETPFKKDIKTEVIDRSDFKKLLLHIKNEIKKNHQILIVYPLVESSENYRYKSLQEAAAFWKKYFKNVYITHGKDSKKENILIEFREKGDILLATTVVEVGISLPRLSTVIIVGAENLGLATLHQLRGRVSRTGIKGYCFLYTEDKKNRRLNEFSKISSGFDIAELDLKYRKSGDLISGYEQSGKSFKWIDLSEDRDIIEKAKRVVGEESN